MLTTSVRLPRQQMSSPWLELVLVAVLIGVNAAFAGTEIALISLRQGQLRRLADTGSTGQLVARLAREPNEFLATIQIGITLAGFLASAVAAVSIAEPLVDPLGFLGAAAEPVAIFIVTVILAFLTLVFGELAPKRIAMQRAERWAMIAARPLNGVAKVFHPIVVLLSWSTDLVVRAVGGDPARSREAVTEEELRELVASEATFSPEHRTIITGAFEISGRVLREVLIPRRDVTILVASSSAADGLRYLAEQGHSRAPVIEGDDFDSVIGVVHMRDLLGEGTVRDAARPAELLPETLDVVSALNALRAARAQMAIVIDEHGGAEGMVTVEDLLEEIVGEIYDETDTDVTAVTRRSDGSFLLPGTFPIHDLSDIGVVLPEGDYATIAGLVLDRLGRVPDGRGDSVEVEDWRLVVADQDGQAITRVWVQPIATA
jgi:putative hemolysin